MITPSVAVDPVLPCVDAVHQWPTALHVMGGVVVDEDRKGLCGGGGVLGGGFRADHHTFPAPTITRMSSIAVHDKLGPLSGISSWVAQLTPAAPKPPPSAPPRDASKRGGSPPPPPPERPAYAQPLSP